MGPKTEKKKSIPDETVASLSDPINTDEWKCAVVLIAEGGPGDVALTRRFAQEASMKTRREVKSIDYEVDFLKIIKDFMKEEISYRISFLLNYLTIFQEAGEYVKNNVSIPVSLTVKIIKALILMFKKGHELDSEGIMICPDNPIEKMAGKPKMPLNWNEDDKGKGARKMSFKNGRTTIRVKPPTPAKMDTKLLRRREQVRNLDVINDVPEDTFFQLYIALTGFRDPELALEMLKEGIPLHGVICLHSSSAVKAASPSIPNNIETFWNDFLQLLWSPHLTRYFKDVVFMVYDPANLPTDEKELRAFIFREISFLMYDLSDLKRQLRSYLRRMRLWNVEEQPEEMESFQSELDQLPHYCMSIPLIMQNLLDTLCGSDDEENDEGKLLGDDKLLLSSTFSMPVSHLAVVHEARLKLDSLIPLTSTLELPTPRWSAIVDTDDKSFLYKKMLDLDKLYDFEDISEETNQEADSPTINVCSLKKRRLYCENLDVEIRCESEGLVSKLWMNYPVREKSDGTVLNDPTARLNHPELILNYILYITWIIQMEESMRENHKMPAIADLMRHAFDTRFTVTDGSRIALQKMNRHHEFFSPSHLKIVPPEMLKSLSAPHLQTPPEFSCTMKSFVSDVHIPTNYLHGKTTEMFLDLRNHLGEEALSRMKDYDFIEELNKEDMMRRIEEAASNYSNIRHSYLPLTDCIYLVMYDNPTVNGVQREVYNVMLTTPVGLRDFYNYIFDHEREWLSQQNLEEDDERRKDCVDSLYNPTPDFRGFTEHDFYHNQSIKFMNYEGEVMESVIQQIESSESAPVKKQTTQERDASTQKLPPPVYAEPGEPYNFVGFDFEPEAIQYSGVNTIFKGPDNCSVRASLQERLYGAQHLGIHVQQGGHNLHLYSYSCPQPHLDQPYTFHVEYKNRTILAFSRRVFYSNEDIPPEGGSKAIPDMLEDEKFAYDMKMSFPHGLTVTTVRKHINPCYIKQSYRKNSSEFPANERSRLFLPNGTIIIMMTDNTVQVLKADTSIVTASLDDLVVESSQSESEFSDENLREVSQSLRFRSYKQTSRDGCQITVVDEEVIEKNNVPIITKNEMESERMYYRRMDGTSYIFMKDGSICVEFLDGSKICTDLLVEEMYLNEEHAWDGEDTVESVYVIVHVKIVMEHSAYASAIYDTKCNTWTLNLPCKSEMEIDSRGCYQVRIDDQTVLDMNTKSIQMRRYSPRGEFIISTVADLTVFGENPSTKYCTTVDSRGRRFTVESNGMCYAEEKDEWNECHSSSSIENELEDTTEQKRYFVVRRDLTGFEIIHKGTVTKEIETGEQDAIVYSQDLKTTPVTRYFVLLNEIRDDSDNKWKVESIYPKTRFRVSTAVTSFTYGITSSWVHPFPKTKPKPRKPETLHGRIFLETKPTDCPNPTIGKASSFCDLPKPGTSLSDDVIPIMRRVADQDQEILKEIYYAAIRRRVDANKINRSHNHKIALGKYLKKSQDHGKRREYLKNCIRKKRIPGYFDYPPGIAWFIIQTVDESVAPKREESKSEVIKDPVTSIPSTQITTSSSDVEYNLEWGTEPSFSDLSFRSNITAITAPEMNSSSRCPPFFSPRRAKSEPIYDMKYTPIPNGEKPDLASHDFARPTFADCSFTEEDILTLEKKSSPRRKEPETKLIDLEDLINLGLI